MSKLLKLAGALLALTIGGLPAFAGSLGVGREATTAEIAAWNIDVAPDGTAWNLMSPGLDVLRASYRDGGPRRKLLEPGQVLGVGRRAARGIGACLPSPVSVSLA